MVVQVAFSSIFGLKRSQVTPFPRYRSHMTYEFVDFCERNNIILYFLPPHRSHLLQPLDVGVFHAYKHWHSGAIKDAT